MNFRVIHSRVRTSIETDYHLKDDENRDWGLRLTKTKSGSFRVFIEYPKCYKALLTSTSLANLTRKSHLYELAMKAIETWNIKKDLSDQTKETFGDLIDEL
jgi:hypothetical protein